MKIAVIYKITNNVNGHCYIGSSTNYSRRKKRHFEQLKNNNHHSIVLQRAYNKYGIDNFNIKIILKFPYFNKEDILSIEQYYIDRNNSIYNICKMAGSQLGSKRNDEFKRKCSERMLGKVAWNKGLKLPKHSIELSEKRSRALTGRIVSQETVDKIKNKVSKRIIQYDIEGNFIKEWESLKEVSKKLPCSHSKLSEYINGKSNIKTFKGYIWKLKT